MRLANAARIAGTLVAVGPMTHLAAQDSTGNVLPAVPVAARTAGMGGASTAMIGYAGSVFTNASGLAPIRVMSLEGGFTRLTDTSSYFMGAAAVRLGPVNLGGGLRYLRFDAGSLLNDNLESVLGVVGHVGGVSFGLAGDYFATQDTTGGKRGTLTTDASLTVAFFDIAALGFSVQNVGRIPLRGEQLDLPSSIRLGLSLNLIDTYSNGRLLVTLDQVWSEGGSRTIFGVEGGVVFYGVGLVARLGAGRVPETTAFATPTWGGSLVLGRGALDYAYLRRIGQGPLHLFGFRLTP